jgi:serine protease Do
MHAYDRNHLEAKRSSLGRFILGMLIISIVGGLSIGATIAFMLPFTRTLSPAQTQEMATRIDIQGEPLEGGIARVLPVVVGSTIADIAQSMGPSVVSIVNNTTVRTWVGEFDQSGLGSGVIFKEDEEKIYIITNAHVVQGSNNLVITFLGNYRVEGEIIGLDSATDLAVVAVNKNNVPESAKADLRIAAIGDSSTLYVGDLAVAIGTPLSEAYNNTVTAGVISALDREVHLTDKVLNLVQTDAAINPGNSGGALVGPTGEVIGINTVKFVQDKVEGMGFAIPINDVKPIVAQLLETGKVARPALGITGQDLKESIGFYEIPVGILVARVLPGSSAEDAGLMPNDIILEFAGQKVRSMEDLKEVLSRSSIGDEVSIKIIRGSNRRTLHTTLKEMPTN